MKLLLTIVLIGAAVIVFGPVIAAGVGFVVVIGCTFLWFLPFVLILFSERASGGEKLAWILLMIFFSWFAWIFYFLLAPVSRRSVPESRYYRRTPRRRYYRDREYRY